LTEAWKHDEAKLKARGCQILIAEEPVDISWILCGL